MIGSECRSLRHGFELSKQGAEAGFAVKRFKALFQS